MIFSADAYNSSSKGKQIYGYMQVHLLYPFQTFLYDRKNIPTEFLIPIALFKEAYVKRICIYPILDPSSTINFKEDGIFTLFRLQAPRHLCPSLPGYRRVFLGVPLPSW